jgi:hypothetical protein
LASKGFWNCAGCPAGIDHRSLDQDRVEIAGDDSMPPVRDGKTKPN